MRMGIKTSLLSILTVAAFCGDGFAAASVRAVGGTGTFTSASSATEGSARAGSLRAGGYARPTASLSASAGSAAAPAASNASATSGATMTTGGSVSAGGTSASRAASTPRLSVGKYIGNPVSISTKGKTADDLDLRIDKLERDVSELETDKQDMLDDSYYIDIDQDRNELILNVDRVRTDLELDDGVVVDIDADNDDGIKVVYHGVDAAINGKPQMLISWEDLKTKLDLGGMNGAINESIAGLRSEMLTSFAEVSNRLAEKVDISQPEGKGYALVVNETTGMVEPTGDFYPKSDVYNKTEINELVARTGLEELGDLAYKNQITNDDVANSAAIARGKLAGDIVGVLDWIQWWNDNVPKGPDGKPDGHSYVLSVDQDGNRAWFRVVVDGEEEGGPVIENPEG